MEDKIYILHIQDLVFYVGRTNNPKRRLAEHRSAVKNTENREYKYQLMRMPEVADCWEMTVLPADITPDYDEYSVVLEMARYNRANDIEWVAGLPLTNMRAGDFWDEIVKNPAVATITRSGYRKYRERRQQEISYQRDPQVTIFSDQQWHKDYVACKREEEAKRIAARERREARRIANMEAARIVQEAEWLRTGKII